LGLFWLVYVFVVACCVSVQNYGFYPCLETVKEAAKCGGRITYHPISVSKEPLIGRKLSWLWAYRKL